MRQPPHPSPASSMALRTQNRLQRTALQTEAGLVGTEAWRSSPVSPQCRAGLDLRQSTHPTQPALLPLPGEAASQEDSPPGRRAREEPQPFSWTRVCTQNTSWGFSSASLTVPPTEVGLGRLEYVGSFGKRPDPSPPHQVTRGVAPAVRAS